MLILSRKKNETIVIGDDIVITVVDVQGNQVSLGITAPPGSDGPSPRNLQGDQRIESRNGCSSPRYISKRLTASRFFHRFFTFLLFSTLRTSRNTNGHVKERT